MQSEIRALFSIEIRVIRLKATKYEIITCVWLWAKVKCFGNKANYYCMDIMKTLYCIFIKNV